MLLFDSSLAAVTEMIPHIQMKQVICKLNTPVQCTAYWYRTAIHLTSTLVLA